MGFRQVQQVKALDKNHEKLPWPLIDIYNFVVNAQYHNSEKYRLHLKKNNSFFGSHSLPWVKFTICKHVWEMQKVPTLYVKFLFEIFSLIGGRGLKVKLSYFRKRFLGLKCCQRNCRSEMPGREIVWLKFKAKIPRKLIFGRQKREEYIQKRNLGEKL